MWKEGIQRSRSKETIMPISGCEEKGHIAYCTHVPSKNLRFLESELAEADLPASCSCGTTDDEVTDTVHCCLEQVTSFNNYLRIKILVCCYELRSTVPTIGVPKMVPKAPYNCYN